MNWMIVALTAVVVFTGACKKSGPGHADMPPAQGEGAPPMPALPSVAATGDQPAATATDSRTTGTLYPRSEAQIGPSVSGIISEIAVKEGDRVKKGQVLFRQDARDAVLRRDQAKAALDGAKVQLSAAQIEYDRTKKLYEQRAVNQAQWQQVEARMDGARVGVQQAQVMLNMAAKMVADTVVRAPMDGVITAKLKSEGEMATTMPPSPIVVVQDQQVLELRFRLPERALADIKAGDVVTARFEAIGQTRDAKIVRVNPTIDQRTRTIELIAEIPNDDGGLRPGLLASVDRERPAPAKAEKAQSVEKAEVKP